MLPCSTSWIADILFSLLCFNHSDGKQKTVMTPTSVFPEIDGCLQGQSQGEGGGGGGAFRRGVNCRFGFTQSRVLVGKVGKPVKIIPMNARSSYIWFTFSVS